jgi:hypothetical protein
MISARHIIRALCLTVVSLALSAFAFAAAGGFSGSYKLGTAVASEGGVQLTISLAISNNTSSAISNATISLHEPRAARVIYGQLNGVALPAGARTEVSGSFTVPQELYDSWKKGSSPAMSVSFTDAKGNPVRAFIEF